MLNSNRLAFTMIELIFVIVVLGILAAIAVPKLAATRDDAEIAKGRSDIASIRSAIATERQSRLLRGQSRFISSLDAGVASNTENVKLFDSNETPSATAPTLLPYPIITKQGDGHWMKTGNNTYAFSVMGTPVVFTYYPTDTTVSGTFYRAGTFDCDHSVEACRWLTE